MKTLLTGLFAASLLLLIAGCAEDDEHNAPIPMYEVHLLVSVNPDTIWFVYGEGPVVEINVRLTDENDAPLAGWPVMVQVQNPDIGEVDFETMGGNHSTAWDTTDSEGRAVIPYLAVLSGDNAITAIVEGDTAYATAVGRYPYNGTSLTVSLNAVPNDWCFDTRGDPAQLQVTTLVRDELSLPVPGLTIHFQTEFGDSTTEWGSVTDENGRVDTTWTISASEAFPNEMMPEAACEITAEVSIFSDAALILFRRGCGPGNN